MEKSPKEQKRKPKYGLFSCVAYIFRFLWANERRVVFSAAAAIPVTLAVAALTVYMPSLILEALETAGQFSNVALVIVGLLLAEALAGLANSCVTVWNETNECYVAGAAEVPPALQSPQAGLVSSISEIGADAG